VSRTHQKSELPKQLKKTPIVQVACLKLGLNRTTYYRWRNSDSKFAKAADEAMLEGQEMMNDIAELQLITAIKNNDLSAIMFWLRHHHPSYKHKVEVSSRAKAISEKEELTPEQQALVEQALRMASLLPESKKPKNSL
jgi:hypothetical protein